MQVVAAREWARSGVKFDPSGRPWHVSRGGQIMPVVVKARAELVQRGNETLPHFAITGEIFNPRSRRAGGDGTISGGCIHDELLHYFPTVAPVVRVHLADAHGVPMHAAANAGYWAGHTKQVARDLVKLARHLRVSEPLAAEMTLWVDNFYGDNPGAFDSITTPKSAWAAAIDHFELATAWKADAAAALALLRSVSRAGDVLKAGGAA